MTREERKIRKVRKKKLRIMLVSVVFIYIFFRTIPVFYASSQKTIIAEKGIIEIIEKTTGIIVKDEKIYRAHEQGKVIYLKNEGEKVGIGTKIAQVKLDGNNISLEDELKEIEERIKILKEGNVSKDLFEKDLNKNGQNINKIIDEIQSSSINGEYNKIDNLANELDMRLDKHRAISGETGFIGNTLEGLIKRKEEIIAQMESASKTYYSDKTGLVSYTIDGLEEVFSHNNISSFTVEDFKIIERKIINTRNIENIKPRDSLFKICNNYNWYMIIKLDNESLDNLKEGKDLYIRINGYEDILQGKIYKINKSDKESLIIIKFNDYLYKFLNERYVDIEIIKERYEGYKIPITSIVEKNNVKGVYIKDFSNTIKFLPVKVKGQDNEYAIVEEGEKTTSNSRGKIEVNINGNTEKQYTITLFDRIIVNGKRVRGEEI